MRNDAISKFYNKYSKSVYLYIFSLCKDHHLAQDIMQEAFVKAILSLDIEHENTKAWLFKVCRNLWIDNMRKNKNIINTNIDDAQIEDESAKILKQIIRNEQYLELYNNVSNMNQSTKEAIILYYYLDIPQIKIADIMKISNGSVRTLLYRGRKILREKMEESYE